MRQRIQKVLAAAGVGSRRAVEEMVREGRIAVNGQIVTDLPVLVDPAADRVSVDGQNLKLASPRTQRRYYFLLNKPKDVYCTNVAQGEQMRAVDLLPPGLPRMYPVGRLDAESRGLLLLTNDGELTNKLTHPRYGVAKTYRAMVAGFVTDQTLAELKKGVWLADEAGKGFRAGATHLRIVDRGKLGTVLEITLCEVRNRQVRRMLAGVGHKVRQLVRVRMGSLTLKGLAPGEFRPLTEHEVRQLQALAGRAQKPGV